MADFGGGEMDEDEELQRALQLSMMTAEADNARNSAEKMDEEKKEEVKTEGAVEKMDEEKKDEVDPDYMAQVLMGLPGIDPTDDAVKDLLASLQKKEEDKK